MNSTLSIFALVLLLQVDLQQEAKVLEVKSLGRSGKYTFAVKLSSPDSGCDQYADWWEVLDEEGNLLYRRILGHSHVNEQPFTRSGGPVLVEDDDVVIVRLHMNNTGYAEWGMKGSIKQGFDALTIQKDFAAEAEKQSPLPNGCAF